MNQSRRNIEVTAPSRLHFGLLSFGHSQGRRYGGAGLMVDRPELQLRIEPAASFEAAGPLGNRVAEFASRWTKFHELPDLPNCQVTVRTAPRQHAGLGVGTQLGMSVAVGLCCFAGYPIPSPGELAVSVGRGKRSAIGTYGFAMGGLLAERGSEPREPFAPLDCQLDLPSTWRIVLTCPEGEGLFGMKENHAFAKLPPVPRQRTAQLQHILRDQMFPAAARGDFDEFSNSVYQYGRLAGECFAANQGGPYNGPVLTRIVDAIRQTGVTGAGQSSWGPTVFAIVESVNDAEALAEHLRQEFSLSPDEVWVAAVNRGGARIRVLNSSTTAARSRSKISRISKRKQPHG